VFRLPEVIKVVDEKMKMKLKSDTKTAETEVLAHEFY